MDSCGYNAAINASELYGLNGTLDISFHTVFHQLPCKKESYPIPYPLESIIVPFIGGFRGIGELLDFWPPAFFKCFDSFATLTLDLCEVFDGEFDVEIYVADTD